MFRRNFTTIAIAAVIASLLLIGVNSSHAASITYMYIDNGASGRYVSLTADENISVINWYVKQTYPVDQADDDYELVHTSRHPADTTSVYENIGYLEGHIKIAEYSVKAEVFFINAGGLDTAVDTVSVYKPDTEFGYKESGVLGSSTLTSHYFDGSSIVMDGYVYAYNGTGGAKWGSGRFRHTEDRRGLWAEDDLPEDEFESGETYSYSTSDWGDFFNFPTNGPIVEGKPWVCNTYLRLNVQQDTWLSGIDGIEFNENDNR